MMNNSKTKTKINNSTCYPVLSVHGPAQRAPPHQALLPRAPRGHFRERRPRLRVRDLHQRQHSHQQQQRPVCGLGILGGSADEGPSVAAAGQTVLSLEGEVLHPDERLSAVFQEGQLAHHGDGSIHLQNQAI